MEAKDIIFYKPTNSINLIEALQKAVSYALISFPFTVNRMNLKNEKYRIHNIVKGKIAEILLALFAEEQNIKLDFKAGETPFWRSDNFDFSFQGAAYDLKNNYVQSANLLPEENYLKLPALVPNRFEKDQWSKRNDKAEGVENRGYVFSFLTEDKTSHTRLFDLRISIQTLDFLTRLTEQFSDFRDEKEPFTETWFWDAFSKIGEIPKIVLNRIPTLIICGAAKEKHFSFFADTDDKTCHGYRLYTGQWYENRPEGGISFCNGLINTRIKNATCPMAALPSFKSILLSASEK